MLILTRRVGESVKIGDDIEIKVMELKGSQVRIGVDAPRNVPVHRDELFARMKQREARAKSATE